MRRLGLTHIHTTVYKIGNQRGPTVEHRELYSILCNNLYGKRTWKTIDICIFMLKHCAVHLKLTQHCNSTILQYKTKIKKKVIWQWAIWWRKIGIWILRTSVAFSLEWSYYSYYVRQLRLGCKTPPNFSGLIQEKYYSLPKLHVPNETSGNPTPLSDSVTWPDGGSAIDGCTIWRRWPCHQSPWQGSASLPQPENDIFHVSYFSGQNRSHGSIQLQGGLGNIGEQMEYWVRITDPYTIPLLCSFSPEGESWCSLTIITRVISSPLLSILSYTLVYPILTCFLFNFFFHF